MKDGQWKYKVGGRAQGIVPSLFLLFLFGGVSIYLFLNKHGAFLFSFILTIIAFVLVVSCAFRAAFVKVLIGREGIYYQTKPGNGRFLKYRKISEAWESSGTSLSGIEEHFCNYRTSDGRVVRFSFFPYESEGVEYLIRRVREEGAGIVPADGNIGSREYVIDGKIYGKTSIAGALVLLVLMFAMTVPAVSVKNFGGVGKSILFGGVAAALIILAVTIIRYRCFVVKIGDAGFYFRSNPFNGRYFPYEEILNCRTEKRIYHHRHRLHGGTGMRLYYYYFFFTDKSGRTRKFQFQEPIFGHEAEVLKKRIENGMRKN